MMFESTFNSAYYKELHRYVHSVYRKHKGFNSLKKLFREPMRLRYTDLRSGLATFYYIPTAFTQRLRLNQLEKANGGKQKAENIVL
jgi:anaerobic magnesium-protoporphyrin IX monomethyl ester cyclase